MFNVGDKVHVEYPAGTEAKANDDNPYGVFFGKAVDGEVVEASTQHGIRVLTDDPSADNSAQWVHPDFITALPKGQSDYDRLAAEFAAFKSKVRDLAIDTAREQGWCDQGLNSGLKTLGLPMVETGWFVDVEVRVRVEATDEDDANNSARTMLEEAGYEVERVTYSFREDD